jgi:hypothetical protein
LRLLQHIYEEQAVVFWDVTLRNPVDHQRIRGIYCPHVHDGKLCQGTNKQEASDRNFYLDPEDGSSSSEKLKVFYRTTWRYILEDSREPYRGKDKIVPVLN